LLHLNHLLARFDCQISRVSKSAINRSKSIAEFLKNSRESGSLEWTLDSFLSFVAQHGTTPNLSTSQLLQDFFALYCNQGSTSGYFVEFGACNGVEGSNTLLLERNFQWNGLLAEPGRQWKQDLAVNRNCSIDHRCVYKRTGEKLEFVECGQLSTLKSFADENNDWAKDLRHESNKQYFVETVTLLDLLSYHNAPNEISYMSIDTEGSEYDCLVEFDFQKYSIRSISVEHNFQPSRDLVHRLLTTCGFVRVFTEISDYDDWYVNGTLLR
jgi:hypothetical protein